jgi:hypothetical protein
VCVKYPMFLFLFLFLLRGLENNPTGADSTMVQNVVLVAPGLKPFEV